MKSPSLRLFLQAKTEQAPGRATFTRLAQMKMMAGADRVNVMLPVRRTLKLQKSGTESTGRLVIFGRIKGQSDVGD
jgi:hypothetical protein